MLDEVMVGELIRQARQKNELYATENDSLESLDQACESWPRDTRPLRNWLKGLGGGCYRLRMQLDKKIRTCGDPDTDYYNLPEEEADEDEDEDGQVELRGDVRSLIKQISQDFDVRQKQAAYALFAMDSIQEHIEENDIRNALHKSMLLGASLAGLCTSPTTELADYADRSKMHLQKLVQANVLKANAKKEQARSDLIQRLEEAPRRSKTAILKEMALNKKKYGGIRTLQGWCKDIKSPRAPSRKRPKTDSK